jgi:hypothetical protein
MSLPPGPSASTAQLAWSTTTLPSVVDRRARESHWSGTPQCTARGWRTHRTLAGLRERTGAQPGARAETERMSRGVPTSRLPADGSSRRSRETSTRCSGGGTVGVPRRHAEREGRRRTMRGRTGTRRRERPGRRATSFASESLTSRGVGREAVRTRSSCRMRADTATSDDRTRLGRMSRSQPALRPLPERSPAKNVDASPTVGEESSTGGTFASTGASTSRTVVSR